LYFLAHQPSIQSVDTAITNPMSAARYHCCSIHQQTKMAIMNLAADNALGTLTTLSEGATLADAADKESDSTARSVGDGVGVGAIELAQFK
jgi:hypothetical protein